MSKRTRSRTPAASAARSNAEQRGSSSAAAPAPVEEPAAGPAHPFATFILAAAVTAVWLLGLFGLAATTANPVTLNYHQIVRSRVVITGRVLDLDAGEVEVERVWKGGDQPAQIRVANLSETRAQIGDVYILPLSAADRNAFIVTPADRRRDAAEPDQRRPESSGPLLIYPATSEGIGQLERILSSPVR